MHIGTIDTHPAAATVVPADWSKNNRLGGLRRFAAAITIFNVLGHTVFGFEQSWAQPLAAVAVAYLAELLMEWADAKANARVPRFRGGVGPFIDFLLSAHITGLACAMLLYANDRIAPVALAAAIAVGSKAIFRVNVGAGSRHFLNPSNFGITAVLLLFPWVGIAPPYHFTINLSGMGDWILPGLIICTGSFLNARFTKRLPLLLTWLICFALQATLRSQFFETPVQAALLPMTGLAFILYTFYMVTDPATTPSETRSQIAFGAAVAFTYGALMVSHIVFGLFFALTIVSTTRGLWMYAVSLTAGRDASHIPTGSSLLSMESTRARIDTIRTGEVVASPHEDAGHVESAHSREAVTATRSEGAES